MSAQYLSLDVSHTHSPVLHAATMQAVCLVMNMIPTDLSTHSLRTIYVNRNDLLSRQRCTAELQRRARDQEAGWPKVMLFPEGTTHSREVLLQFKKGAFLPGLPVQVPSTHALLHCVLMHWLTYTL